MKKIFASSAMAVALILTTGCAPKGYSQSQVGQNMQVEPGVVQSVKQVALDNNGVGNTLGGIVGTVAGAAAGNQVGGGTGQVVASVLGAAVGGALGGSVGDQIDTGTGQEIVVKLNNGKTVATVLRLNGATQALMPGQAVNVFISGGRISNISAR